MYEMEDENFTGLTQDISESYIRKINLQIFHVFPIINIRTFRPLLINDHEDETRQQNCKQSLNALKIEFLLLLIGQLDKMKMTNGRENYKDCFDTLFATKEKVLHQEIR